MASCPSPLKAATVLLIHKITEIKNRNWNKNALIILLYKLYVPIKK